MWHELHMEIGNREKEKKTISWFSGFRYIAVEVYNIYMYILYHKLSFIYSFIHPFMYLSPVDIWNVYGVFLLFSYILLSKKKNVLLKKKKETLHCRNLKVFSTKVWGYKHVCIIITIWIVFEAKQTITGTAGNKTA